MPLTSGFVCRLRGGGIGAILSVGSLRVCLPFLSSRGRTHILAILVFAQPAFGPGTAAFNMAAGGSLDRRLFHAIHTPLDAARATRTTPTAFCNRTPTCKSNTVTTVTDIITGGGATCNSSLPNDEGDIDVWTRPAVAVERHFHSSCSKATIPMYIGYSVPPCKVSFAAISGAVWACQRLKSECNESNVNNPSHETQK